MNRFIISLLTIIILSGCGQSEAAVLGISASGSIVSQASLAACNTAANIKECRVTSPQVVTTAIVKASDREITFSEGGYVTFTGVGALTGLSEARPEWFGPVDGVADNVQIQAAIEAVTSATATSSKVILTSMYTTAASVTLYRGVTLEGSGVDSGIHADGNFPAIKFASKNGSFPNNVLIENMTLQGSDNGAHTLNTGIEVANGVTYSMFRNVRLLRFGGNAINSLGGEDGGGIYNNFANVQIFYPHKYGVYLTGNVAQTTFTNVRIYGLAYALAGVVFESADNNSSVLCNTFIGGGVESGNVAEGKPAAGFKAVWFKGDLYSAYKTKFINFYLEPEGPDGAPAGTAENQVTTGYYIEAARGVHISGGYIASTHVGVWLANQYSEGVSIDNVEFVKSNSWAADTSTGAMIKVANANVAANVGVGNTKNVSGTYDWPMYSEVLPYQSVYGYREFDKKLEVMSETSVIRTGDTLQSYSTRAASNTTAHTFYTKNGSAVNTLRYKLGGGATIVDAQYLATNLIMNSSDTGGSQGRIDDVHSLNFTARAASSVANSHVFVDSADGKLKFKDAGGVVNLLY